MQTTVSRCRSSRGAIATGLATFIGRIFLLTPLTVDSSSAITLCPYAALGVVIGFAATAFVRGLTLLEDLFEHIRNR
jgi:chloride channel protein, CIC family